jgi:hypothetical protein
MLNEAEHTALLEWEHLRKKSCALTRKLSRCRLQAWAIALGAVHTRGKAQPSDLGGRGDTWRRARQRENGKRDGDRFPHDAFLPRLTE